ncbi:DNA/RNA helicase, superfamily II [Leptolyngbya sp. PCC 7375]|nr:DNA/RNA helicase, superfamily II [Leptolyngbya sp. PCC 7375]
MLATVRNRRALIAEVEPFSAGPEGQIHLVRLEYIDSDGPPEDSLIWEREIDQKLLEPTTLPPVEKSEPMNSKEFDALQRATRWTALSPYLGFDRSQPNTNSTIAAPFFGAVQVEDFQLVPLLKALKMPRISLMLADDVGLGKTVEAGLILSELLLRRRIRRVLILSPAALRKQWQQEMKTKFALSFDVIDRAETHALQKRLGLDANPWRTFPRIVTSYHYLRQPDVLEQFRSACKQPEGTAQLPWDLLIVDEAHNLMPSNFGEDSDLSKMLRAIAPWFEHKLFLSATPHNGHTRCFSGLLQQLDPVRFTQTSEFTSEMRKRIPEVVIRRLKREINALDEQEGRTPRFCRRLPDPVPLYFSRAERQLSESFEAFRSSVKQLIAQSSKKEQLAGSFAVEVLNKRLLSCPYTFANSWFRFREGNEQQGEEVDAGDVQAARRSTQADLDDDQESEGRFQHAAKTTGAWFKPLITRLQDEIAAIDQALEALQLTPDDEGELPYPAQDERWERLLDTVEQHLRVGNDWKGSDRIVVFTEYKTTLDYLVKRLGEAYSDQPGVVRQLYGGMDDRERDDIKTAFNDPDNVIRILIATDAASEGLNLQETAHIVMHYDIPWNPARLDQRNGRLDRHGQAQDVIVLHFTSEDDADLKFLARVVEKVNTIREELGSMGEVFDAAFQRRFIELEDTDRVVASLEQAMKYRRGRSEVPSSEETAAGQMAAAALATLKQELDLTPENLTDTLEIALGLQAGGLPRFEIPDEQGRLRLRTPIPQQWEATVDDHLRVGQNNGHKGALPAIVFDPQHFIQTRNNRPVYRPAKDTVLMHLGHPMFHQALGLYARARFPGENSTGRWTVRYGDIPAGADALLLLTVEELAVNELREPFHHWVRTVRYPISQGELGEALAHQPVGQDTVSAEEPSEAAGEQASELWDEIKPDVQDLIGQLIKELTKQLTDRMADRKKTALKEEKVRFKHRISEVQKAMKETTLKKLAKERDKLMEDMQQLSFIPQERKAQEDKLRDLDDELKRRNGHYQILIEQLEMERDRVIDQILPKRYSIRGQAQVFPVTVEFRLAKED